jgi:hypothetical protein
MKLVEQHEVLLVSSAGLSYDALVISYGASYFFCAYEYVFSYDGYATIINQIR